MKATIVLALLSNGLFTDGIVTSTVPIMLESVEQCKSIMEKVPDVGCRVINLRWSN